MVFDPEASDLTAHRLACRSRTGRKHSPRSGRRGPKALTAVRSTRAEVRSQVREPHGGEKSGRRHWLRFTARWPRTHVITRAIQPLTALRNRG